MTPISTAVRTASQRNTCRYRRSSWAACSAKWDDAALCVAMGELLQEVDEREDEDPDQVHEVPVEGGDLDLAVALGGVLAEERADENRAEVHDAREDVQPVEAREDEEGGAEEILADRLPLVEDELVPLVGLEREKDRAAEHREQEEAAQLRLVAVADAGERFHHRDAAAHEQERHEGGELDPQDRRRPRPGGIDIASAARKIHMPSLPQLSGVSGDSAGSTSRWCSATATDVTSGLLRLRGLRCVAARPRQLDHRGAAASRAAPVENHEAERRGDEHRVRRRHEKEDA